LEIIFGVVNVVSRSTKLKPFWLSLNEKEDNIATLELLSKVLLGETVETVEESGNQTVWSAPEYEAALHRALKISTCPVVPFFGAYIRELRNILTTPSLVVVSTGSEQQQLQVKNYHMILIMRKISSCMECGWWSKLIHGRNLLDSFNKTTGTLLHNSL
jgi:hypothetical protein